MVHICIYKYLYIQTYRSMTWYKHLFASFFNLGYLITIEKVNQILTNIISNPFGEIKCIQVLIVQNKKKNTKIFFSSS